jgi:hypothetical protein
MAEPTAEEWAVLERAQQALAAGDRETWLACFDPAFVADLLPDWPGPGHVEGAEAAWDAYLDFFAQFDNADYQYLNVEKQGYLTIGDIHCQLVGLASGVPGELMWTLVAEFDSASQRYIRGRWFHAREEALIFASSQVASSRA